MTKRAAPVERQPTDWQTPAMQRRVRRRYAAERRFRLMGVAAVFASAAFLVYLLATMIAQGAGGFTETRIALPLDLRGRVMVTPAQMRGSAADLALAGAGLENAVDAAADTAFGAQGGAALLSDGAWLRVRDAIEHDPQLLLTPTTLDLPVATEIDMAYKGNGARESEAIVAALDPQLSRGLNISFFTGADATDPTRAGIWGALKGSLLTMIVTLGLAFPIGVLSALYLEEYAPRNRWTDLIEVSINNLAAVPSIIFGLLGLAVFLGTFHMPRSGAIVGGLTLALMTMPVIVIAGRNAITAVPPSIRDAARALGASPIQVVFHHVLPLALPGILTGTIIGMARALGETAPLLMIGMRAFIAAPPDRLTDPATVLPVQIFLWSDDVQTGFVEKTSAAIIVLLVVLLAMNGFAIYLRNRFETRWK
ncbi:phosphate ABC transporter permease PstA [Sphingomonas sp. 8AM]|uniref:phosphate ABC transporter permease PstA n=1 Tax=Sphingomonas sp. 8AM TaxID=2653170 RepID=UPI0012F13953|nr:phosphate ABC transporter permease PstA [Sphingomonas sp. 8AM]VXC78879.1 Phosphate transport system permease protein PstA [Sphingomonas sp. 8AM]